MTIHRRAALKLGALMLAGACVLSPVSLLAQDASTLPVITVGVQASGTAQWEMTVIKEMGLDTANGVNLVLRDVADSRAGQIALQAGEVDIILSDFVYASIQRNQGSMLTFVPHSLAVGGLMVDPNGPVATLEDLEGKTLGVAGGPVDKAWVTFQAYYAQQHDGARIADLVDARYGAPPLINEILFSGEAAGSLNFWHFNARAKVAGMVQLISVPEMLTAMGIEHTPPLLGWVFSDETAAEKNDAIVAFLNASFAAKDVLLTDDAVWDGLRELMNAVDSDELFNQLKTDYRAGIVTSYGQADIDAAMQSFALMAQWGGAELVGDVPTLAEGTFWTGYSR